MGINFPYFIYLKKVIFIKNKSRIKKAKEYEEKYGTEDIENLTTRENNNTSAINKSTNCKSHQKDSLLSSMSNIMEDEDDDEHNTNNNQNLHSAKSSRFNTHFSYFNTNK